MTELWLPEGHHFDLHISHRPLESAGPFTGGGNKWVWHTTESEWDSVDTMFAVLKSKRAAPHLLIGGRPGLKHPVVIQMVPFNRAGRSLANDPDGFETNRADCIQCEICWRAALSGDMRDWHMKALANLVKLTNLTVDQTRVVPRKFPRNFKNTTRFTDAEFVKVQGHVGHMHTPDNDHTDPGTGFRWRKLRSLLVNMPKKGYDL